MIGWVNVKRLSFIKGRLEVFLLLSWGNYGLALVRKRKPRTPEDSA